eukprot:CAMPEP_0172423848 /NCGR_PEP_ID=MMETSP1064-20121228/17777_1 /TAXON_ID=202472 /ORGANISM="Aulacoseira subarctica , Strain CCAP 1002/5" /LENGTH=164 /DNA_ID=CAMNT_0013165399 /DNA_START=79 /DNA_END=573 /DNA_ORIENTATION=+
MSVNEVKNKISVLEFDVRGTGDPGSRTFAIGNEDHTLGNALRHVLMQNNEVEFAGYSVPHPSEPILQLRVQTVQPRQSTSIISNDGNDKTTNGRCRTPAINALQESCHTLSDICDFLLVQMEKNLPQVKQDRIQIELYHQQYQEEQQDYISDDEEMAERDEEWE